MGLSVPKASGESCLQGFGKETQFVAINCVFRASAKVTVPLKVVRAVFVIRPKYINQELSTRGQGTWPAGAFHQV